MEKLVLDINSPAPKWWKFISRSVRFFCSGFVTMLSTGNPFKTPELKNTVLFILGVVLLMFQSADAGFGSDQNGKAIAEKTGLVILLVLISFVFA